MFIVNGHPSDWFPMEQDGFEVGPWRDSTLLHSDNVPTVREGIETRPIQTGDRVTLPTLQDAPRGDPPYVVPFASATVSQVAVFDDHHHIIARAAFEAFKNTDEIGCEVNTAPPDPGSHRFHQWLGFEQVGTRSYDGGAKSVAYYTRPF